MKGMLSWGMRVVVLIGLVLGLVNDVTAAFDSGSTGVDGALEVKLESNATAVYVNGLKVGNKLDLPEGGIFNFTTITVDSGATLTFGKNAKNTPVTLLASGDVTINGNIHVNGGNANYLIGGAGGPGGFDGGTGAAVTQTGLRGEGPGGGYGGKGRANNDYGTGCGEGGGYAYSGYDGGSDDNSYPGGSGSYAYGNERILPLMGGSGGGGGGGVISYVGGGGGGGGGALLIASSTTISLTGSIAANGGGGAHGEHYYGCDPAGGGGGGGSGGAIRLVANIITGNGAITASGGGGGYTRCDGHRVGGTGSVGRIRLEAGQNLRTVGTSPPYTSGPPYAVIPPGMPELKIVSINGLEVPTIPTGDFNAPDIVFPFGTKNPLPVVVAGTNIPVGTNVTVKVNPAVGSTTTSSPSPLQGSVESSSVTIPVSISTAYPSTITAFVTYQLTAQNFFIDGEKVEQVRVASVLGGKSSVTYITATGREIPAVL